MDDLILRECSFDDLEDILLLQNQWAKEDITFGFVPAEKEYLISKLGSYFLVAEVYNTIIGFVYGTIHKAKDLTIFLDGEFYIEIDDIYISYDYRGKNIGNLLLDEILLIAKENGIIRSLIYSSTKDLGSIVKFYKKHGFKTWYVQMFK